MFFTFKINPHLPFGHPLPLKMERESVGGLLPSSLGFGVVFPKEFGKSSSNVDKRYFRCENNNKKNNIIKFKLLVSRIVYITLSSGPKGQRSKS